MKVFSYIFMGVFIFIALEFLAVNLGNFMGAGENDIGILVSSVSLLSTIVILCTAAIIDNMKK